MSSRIEIMNGMLCSGPMCIPQVTVELAQVLHHESNVWTHGHGGIHDASDSSEIRDLRHSYFIFITRRAKSLG